MNDPSVSDPLRAPGIWLGLGLNVLGALSHAGFAMASYSELPSRYPIHFDLHGQPNGWASGQSMQWFLLPAISFSQMLLMSALALLMAHLSLRYWNLPYKEQLLKLSPQAQRPLRQALGTFFLLLSLLDTALLFAIQWLLYTVAVGQRASLSPLPLVLGAAAYLVLLAFGVVRLRTLAHRAVEHQNFR